MHGGFAAVKVSAQDETAAPSQGLGFGGGLAIGIASGAVVTLAVGGILLRLRRRAAVDERSGSPRVP
ncbi:hypothetical protein [Streptomyces sp. RTd22]|uniref:hypothetical protein n=1 Tax=Streptomyces sp. RTd22 TaxID=1841249 RepID=UPI00131CA823|nr:hypothetical protein [Streptomyces sp. RTd22]